MEFKQSSTGRMIGKVDLYRSDRMLNKEVELIYDVTDMWEDIYSNCYSYPLVDFPCDYEVTESTIKGYILKLCNGEYGYEKYKFNKEECRYRLNNKMHRELLSTIKLLDLQKYVHNIFHWREDEEWERERLEKQRAWQFIVERPPSKPYYKRTDSEIFVCNNLYNGICETGKFSSESNDVLYDKENNVIFVSREYPYRFVILIPTRSIVELDSLDDFIVVYDSNRKQEENTLVDTKYKNDEYRIKFEKYFNKIIEHLYKTKVNIDRELRMESLMNKKIKEVLQTRADEIEVEFLSKELIL